MDRTVFTRRRLTGLAIALAVLAMVIVGALTVARSTVGQVAQRVAEMVAADWTRMLSTRMPEIEQILDGQRPSEEAERFVRIALDSGAPFRFKLFNANGDLRYVSDERWRPRARDTRLVDHNPTALSVVVKGETLFNLADGDGVKRPELYSEVYAPIVRNGVTIGVAELYLDETAHLAVLTGELTTITVEIALVLLVLFGAPAAAYWLRSSQLHRVQHRLRQAVQFDELTGALTRSAMSRNVEEKMEEAERVGGGVAVLLIDLDNFKELNDTHGHAVGDAVLSRAANRIRAAAPDDAAVARLSGDEFEICLAYPDGDDATAENVASGIVEAMKRPFRIGELSVRVGASIGYSFDSWSKTSPGALQREADTALVEAKNAGRGRATQYHSSMDADRQERRHVVDALRRAVSRDGFELHYQPLYDCDAQKLRGFEALLRLKDEDGKPIRPDIFIGVAEQLGLIEEIGVWVLGEACAAARHWPENLTIAVNLSPAQFGHGALVGQVRKALRESGLAAERLELEVTENLLISEADSEVVLAELTELKRLGVSIALDDFGTGYSSLGYLWKFPFDRLKVDKSFMRDLEEDGSKSREILSTIIALGHVLDLSITAEGVETEEQASILRALRCDVLQGYLLGRPAPREETEALIFRDVAETRRGRVVA